MWEQTIRGLVVVVYYLYFWKILYIFLCSGSGSVPGSALRLCLDPDPQKKNIKNKQQQNFFFKPCGSKTLYIQSMFDVMCTGLGGEPGLQDAGRGAHAAWSQHQAGRLSHINLRQFSLSLLCHVLSIFFCVQPPWPCGGQDPLAIPVAHFSRPAMVNNVVSGLWTASCGARRRGLVKW